MKYYITKKDDTIDTILNRFGITYQTFISLNNIYYHFPAFSYKKTVNSQMY